ncbi:MAG: hypothetical protein AB2L24_01825 [Mangrovibacterium sp.]
MKEPTPLVLQYENRKASVKIRLPVVLPYLIGGGLFCYFVVKPGVRMDLF